MVRINIVYQNKNMPDDVLPPVTVPDQSYMVVWSRHVLPGFDVVVYFNHYTYHKRIHDKICPKALKILYMYEPLATDPVQYTRRVWRQFDALLTWNTYLTGSSPVFVFEAGAYYDLPYCRDYGVHPLSELPNPVEREKAICQICGDKYSLTAEELYSVRRKLAHWFHEHAQTRMDVFGRPPMDTPNYRGESPDKMKTLSRYRYALCFENTFHPFWTKGYLTEKILDCMAALTVPVYYGCSNIEELVPPDCFIDFRRFTSPEDLDRFLQAMTDEEYLGYAERMRDFLTKYNAPERHSVYRLYETVAAVVEQASVVMPAVYPKDYEQLSSFAGKCRLMAMRVLLPGHRFVYPVFAIIRWFKKSF